jgi:hypothetical protein
MTKKYAYDFELGTCVIAAHVLETDDGLTVEAPIDGETYRGAGATLEEAIEAVKSAILTEVEVRRSRTVDGQPATVVIDGTAPRLDLPAEKLSLHDALERLRMREANAEKAHDALSYAKEVAKTADAEVSHAMANLRAAAEREVAPELPLGDEDDEAA